MKHPLKRIALLSVVLMLLFATACTPAGDTQATTSPNPWENGGKQPAEYTYEEFEKLTPAQQIAFQNSFGSLEAFDQWLQKAQYVPTELPWENGGKQPEEYTYEEFEALTPAQQIAFQNSFESMEEFDKWLKSVRYAGIALPWENGGKQPSAYTYEEYEALTDEQKNAFRDHIGGLEAFNAWLQGVETEQVELPWENGGKQPSDYTYEEFEKLSLAQQIAFQNSFASAEEFEKWLERVKPQETVQSPETDLPWKNGGKQPSSYTYAEFEALTPAQQIAFQSSFGSMEKFDQWLQKVQYEETDLPWENGGKQPKDYTYAEFEALTPAQQIAFQNSFGSIEAFDKWLTANTTQ